MYTEIQEILNKAPELFNFFWSKAPWLVLGLGIGVFINKAIVPLNNSIAKLRKKNE